MLKILDIRGGLNLKLVLNHTILFIFKLKTARYNLWWIKFLTQLFKHLGIYTENETIVDDTESGGRSPRS